MASSLSDASPDVALEVTETSNQMRCYCRYFNIEMLEIFKSVLAPDLSFRAASYLFLYRMHSGNVLNVGSAPVLLKGTS